MRSAGFVLIVGLALAGCSDPSHHGPLDGTPGGDGAGLVFRFVSEPSLPGGSDGEQSAVIERAELVLRHVRVIGDSSPGGEVTSADSLALSWAGGAVEELRFPQAPPGIYALLMAELVSYEIDGTVQIGGEGASFRVAEPSASGIQVSVTLDELELEPGEDRVATIRVNLSDVIAAVDWEQVPPDGENVRYVGAASSQSAGVRERLAVCIAREHDGSSGPVSGD